MLAVLTLAVLVLAASVVESEAGFFGFGDTSYPQRRADVPNFGAIFRAYGKRSPAELRLQDLRMH